MSSHADTPRPDNKSRDAACGEPNPLRHVNPQWDVTCHLPAGHTGLHQTAWTDDEGTETVSWAWDETRNLLGPAHMEKPPEAQPAPGGPSPAGTPTGQ